jgi:hypothetical protein
MAFMAALLVLSVSLLQVAALEVEPQGSTGKLNYSPAIDMGEIPTDKCGVVVMRNEDERLEVFAIGPEDSIYHKWQKVPNGKEWTSWQSLGGSFRSGPAVAKDPAVRLQVFSRGQDKAYYYKSQQKASVSGDFTDFKTLGGKFRGGPVVSRDSEGFLHVFGRGFDNNLHHRQQLPDAEGGEVVWTEWQNLGGLLTGFPSILLDHESLLHIFIRGQDRALWHLKQLPLQTEKSIVQWGTWESLGGVLASSPRVPPIMNSVNLIEVVVRATDKAHWLRGQTASHQGGVSWGDWKSLGGIMSSGPSVVLNDEGTMDTFGRGPDRHVWTKHQYLTKAGLSWTSWVDLGGITSTTPASAVRGDGTLQLFTRGADRAIWTRMQEPNTNGTLIWTNWVSLGGNTKSFNC